MRPPLSTFKCVDTEDKPTRVTEVIEPQKRVRDVLGLAVPCLAPKIHHDAPAIVWPATALHHTITATHLLFGQQCATKSTNALCPVRRAGCAGLGAPNRS
jgi:hypothetical protein